MSKDNLPIRKKKEYVDNRKFDDNGDIVEKKCSECNEFKSINEFYNNKTQFDGTYPNCIVCFKDKNNSKHKKSKIEDDGLDSFFSSDNDVINSGSLDNIIDDLSKGRIDYDQ